MTKLDVPTIALGGLPLAVIDRAQSAKLMVEAAMARRGSNLPPLYVTSANGQVLSMCARDRTFRSQMLSADLIHADGTPLVLVSRFNATLPLPERVATTDLFHDVARLASERQVRFYMLGATPDVIARAVEKARKAYPRLEIVGYRDGYFSRDEEAEVVAAINAARPDILWVGLGAPAEQAFCVRNLEALTSVGMIKTSGGLFDFLSGKNTRAPQWMQSAGLEWLYRMVLEPRRLTLRYLTTNPHALYLLLTSPAGPIRSQPTRRS